MSRKTLLFGLLGVMSLPALAAVYSRPEPFTQAVSLDAGGTLTIENPNGPITIIGTNSPGLTIEGFRTIRGLDAQAIQEGRNETNIEVLGNAQTRHIRTVTPFPFQNKRWESIVSYTLRVPQNVNLTVVNFTGDFLRLSNISGSVFIKHVNGPIELTGVSGATIVDSANGNITVRYLAPPQNNARLKTINGSIDVSVPGGSSFEWVAQTLRGEIFSSIPVRGEFLPAGEGRAYRAAVRRGSKPKIITTAVTGRVYLLGSGEARTAAKLIRSQESSVASAPRPSPVRSDVRSMMQNVTQRMLIQPPTARSFTLQLPRFEGNFNFSTSLGNIFVGELAGDAKIITRAGEIVLGKVDGSCFARSGGGSLNFGDIGGPLSAHTTAGDVLVKAARKGGTISTDAGNILVTYSAGRLNLFSGGGDITVRQAAGPVRAESRSGDITLQIDPSSGSQQVEARSVGGNVVLNLSPGFGATIEAVTLTSINESNPIQSDFTGLEISSDRVGDKIRTRAAGKINGGGEKVQLHAENGMIYIRSRVLPATPSSSQ